MKTASNKNIIYCINFLLSSVIMIYFSITSRINNGLICCWIKTFINYLWVRGYAIMVLFLVVCWFGSSIFSFLIFLFLFIIVALKFYFYIVVFGFANIRFIFWYLFWFIIWIIIHSYLGIINGGTDEVLELLSSLL